MTPIIFVVAALAEIGGCFAVWAWWRDGASNLWLIAAAAALMVFAWLLAQADAAFAGRAFAAYGGVYIAASLAWGWLVEGKAPDRWDLIGGAFALAGAWLILYGPRHA